MYSILDVLASVGRDWEMLHGEPSRGSPFEVRLCTPNGRSYRDANNRVITPDGPLPDPDTVDILIVPDMHLDPLSPLPTELVPIGAWIKSAHDAGAITTSVCSGALLLGLSGVLEGLEATTHWAYSDRLAEEFEKVTVRRERILVPAGDGHRIVTAGGASAWADLLLYLISRMSGIEEARRIAKLYLIEPHLQSQMSFASLTAGRQHTDAVILELQSWIGQNYDHANPVSRIAEISGLNERTLLRRFKAATGQTPISYVQTIRIEEAKQVLETTDAAIDDIAVEVGYSEPSSFRAAFKKRVGISAGAYRKKWRKNLINSDRVS